MAKVVLIFLLLFSAVAFSQVTVQQYNKSVNEAELYIVSGEYQAAIVAYENAFEQRKQPFNADLYNAAVCWIKLGSWQNGKQYLNKLARRGVSLEQLTEMGFSSLYQNTEWQQYAAFYNQLFETPELNPFITKFDNSLRKLDSLDNIATSELVQAIYNKMDDSVIVEYIRKDGSQIVLSKKSDDKSNSKKNTTPDSIFTAQLRDDESLILQEFDSLLLQTKNSLFQYLETYSWPEEERLTDANPTYSSTNFYKNLQRYISYRPPFVSTQRQQKFGNLYLAHELSGADSVRFHHHLKLAIDNGKIPPLAALKLGYAYEFNRLPTEDIVFIRTEPDENCPELMSKYNARFMQRPRKNTLSAERFDELKKQLNIADRENLTRLHIFNNSLNDSFIFELNKYSEEAVLPTCFTLREFLETAILVE